MPQPIKLKNLNDEVTAFLNEQHHPFSAEIEQLRRVILIANDKLTENIKWNGPNYCIENEYRITMRIHPPKEEAQLIFHCGAKVKEQPKGRLVKDDAGILLWKENNRAIATFKSAQDIELNQVALSKIINEWLSAAK